MQWEIQKKGKWILHELSELAIQNHLSIICIIVFSSQKKQFLYQIVTGDENGSNIILSKKSVNQSSTPTLKHNIHENKILLCTW